MGKRNPEMESPFDAGEPEKTPEQEAADQLERALEGEEKLKPDVMKAMSEFGESDEQTLFTKETEEAKQWTKLESDLMSQYDGIIERLMGGARDTLDPISQKVFDAHVSAKGDIVKSVISELKEKKTPPERAMEQASKEIENRLFGQM